MRAILSITSALSDESRVRALMALRQGELCVCQIVELLQLAPSTVSKHLSILRDAGLIDGRKEARWIYCFMPEKPTPAAAKAIAWLRASLADDERIRADEERLRAILKENKEDLCRRQMGRGCC